MIQFNLLPDVKIEFLRARYRMRLIVGASILISAVSIFFFLSLYSFVKFGQGTHIKNLDRDIDKSAKELQASSPDLNRVLTVQNQLASLPQLHDDKAISSRIFKYLLQLTPQAATISDVQLDLEEQKITLKGNTGSLETVNKFVDTLKFTEYQLSTDSSPGGRAFSGVVLNNFSVSSQQGQPTADQTAVSYEISASFDPIIFKSIKDDSNSAEPIKLVIPNIISTRSLSTQDSELFLPQRTPEPQLPMPITNGGDQ